MNWSGGGFSPSEYFTRNNATWQNDAVEAYLSSGVKLPPQGKWDKAGRGIPDVSAVGVDFQVGACAIGMILYIRVLCPNRPIQVVTDGSTGGVSGTSASCPSVAGIFSLLNDARMAAGKPPMGHLNPFIYQATGDLCLAPLILVTWCLCVQNMGAFNDIKKGKNNGGGLKSLLAGFEATTGWDPVTGVGTPNYPKLLAAAMAI